MFDVKNSVVASVEAEITALLKGSSRTWLTGVENCDFVRLRKFDKENKSKDLVTKFILWKSGCIYFFGIVCVMIESFALPTE